MGKLDFGNAVKKAGNMAKTAAQEGAAKAQVGVKALKTVTKKEADKLSETVKNAADRRKTEKAAAAEKAAAESAYGKAVAPRSALKIFYYLMEADGKIAAEEEEKFGEIGKELDAEFDEHKDAVIGECKAQSEKMIVEEDYYDVLRDGVEDALSEDLLSITGYIPPKLLLWDLMVIAYSDGEYNETEQRLLKYIMRKLDIPKDVFLEMETDLLTIHDIEGEIAWIKTTDRPYLEIENQIKELEKRKNDIFLAAKALIAL